MEEGRSDGCYELMREYIGKYTFNPATGTYSRYIPEHSSAMLQYRDANGNMITEAPLTLESARMLVQEAITAQ